MPADAQLTTQAGCKAIAQCCSMHGCLSTISTSGTLAVASAYMLMHLHLCIEPSASTFECMLACSQYQAESAILR